VSRMQKDPDDEIGGLAQRKRKYGKSKEVEEEKKKSETFAGSSRSRRSIAELRRGFNSHVDMLAWTSWKPLSVDANSS